MGAFVLFVFALYVGGVNGCDRVEFSKMGGGFAVVVCECGSYNPFHC